MKNPFVYGKEVSGKDFCNRKKEIAELTRDVLNSQNVMLFSQRRFGKTSLIKEVFRRSRKEGIITVYVDLYPMLSEEDFVSIYGKAIATNIFGKLEKTFKELAALFKRIRPSFSLEDSGELAYSFNIDQKGIDSSIEDVLESVKRHADKHKKQIAVCFDEFQQIGQFKTDKLEKLIRSSVQQHANISYIFMGSKKHLITDIFNNPNRPFYRSAKPFPLQKIGAEELTNFLLEKFSETGKQIEIKLVKKIIEVCEEHPYYVQYLAHIIWEISLDLKKVTEKEINNGLNMLLEREKSTYEATWDLLTVQQKKALTALALQVEKDQLFSQNFIQKNKLKSTSTFRRTLESLIDKDLIDKADNNYSIIDVFFKKWIISLGD